MKTRNQFSRTFASFGGMGCCLGFCLLILSLIPGATADSESRKSTKRSERFEGRVEQKRGADTNLVFKTTTGKNYLLKRDEMSESLFLDTNLWSKKLVITGRIQNEVLEVTGNLHSIKNGKLHELFYYCDICSITSSYPGLCQCCREPSVLVEEPSK